MVGAGLERRFDNNGLHGDCRSRRAHLCLGIDIMCGDRSE